MRGTLPNVRHGGNCGDAIEESGKVLKKTIGKRKRQSKGVRVKGREWGGKDWNVPRARKRDLTSENQEVGKAMSKGKNTTEPGRGLVTLM